MESSALLTVLESIARREHFVVRTEAMDPTARLAGGICKVRGRTLVVLDEARSPFERACVLAEALRAVDLTRATLDDEVRAFITWGPQPKKIIPRERLRPLAKARPRLYETRAANTELLR